MLDASKTRDDAPTAIPYRGRIHDVGRPSIRRNSIWLFAGNAIYSVCQWGVLAVLAKLGNPETLGSFAVALAIANPVLMLSNLQLRGILATDARGDYAFKDYFVLRLVMSLLAFSALTAGAVLFSDDNGMALLIVAVAGTKVVDSWSDVLYGLFQKHELMKQVGGSLALRGLTGFLLAAATFWLTGSLVAAVGAMGLGWVSVFLLHDVPHAWTLALLCRRPRDEVGEAPRAAAWKRIVAGARVKGLLLLALPMGGVMMLISLSDSLPRYVIEHYIGVRELGFYAAVASLAVVAQTIVSAVASAAAPRLAAYNACGDYDSFKNLLIRNLGFGLLVGVAALGISVAAGAQLLTVLFTREYAAYTDILVLLMFVAVIRFQMNVLGSAVTAMRRFRVQFLLQLFNVLVIGTISILLVESYGLLGVIFALFAGAFFLASSYGWIVHESIRALRASGL